MVSEKSIIEVHVEVVDTIMARLIQAMAEVAKSTTFVILFLCAYRIMNSADCTKITFGESVGSTLMVKIIDHGCLPEAVSYTHLTLPTTILV